MGLNLATPEQIEDFMKDKKFVKYLEAQRKRFEITLGKSSLGKTREGYKRFLIMANKKIQFRCQSYLTDNEGQRTQCHRACIGGNIFCIKHKTYKGGPHDTRIKAIKKSVGLYDIKDAKGLQKELHEIEDVDPEKFKNVDDELKLSVALLRKFLKKNNDADIMKSPGRLLWILDNIVRFKRTKWEMSHAPEVSFSRQQVEYILINVRTIIIDSVKDGSVIDAISGKMQQLGVRLKEEGFTGK